MSEGGVQYEATRPELRPSYERGLHHHVRAYARTYASGLLHNITRVGLLASSCTRKAPCRRPLGDGELWDPVSFSSRIAAPSGPLELVGAVISTSRYQRAEGGGVFAATLQRAPATPGKVLVVTRRGRRGDERRTWGSCLHRLNGGMNCIVQCVGCVSFYGALVAGYDRGRLAKGTSSARRKTSSS